MKDEKREKKRKGMVESIPDTGNASNQIRIKTKRLLVLFFKNKKKNYQCFQSGFSLATSN